MTNAPRSNHQLERWTGRVLRVGVWSSATLLVAGLALAARGGFAQAVPEHNPSIGALVRQLFSASMDAHTLMFAGLVLLMCTPILRVITAAVGFAAERDRRFTVVALVVLVMLVGEIIYSLSIQG